MEIVIGLTLLAGVYLCLVVLALQNDKLKSTINKQQEQIDCLFRLNSTQDNISSILLEVVQDINMELIKNKKQ